MLNTVFKDAIINREKTLSILKGPEYEKIIQKAKENHIKNIIKIKKLTR